MSRDSQKKVTRSRNSQKCKQGTVKKGTMSRDGKKGNKVKRRSKRETWSWDDQKRTQGKIHLDASYGNKQEHGK